MSLLCTTYTYLQLYAIIVFSSYRASLCVSAVFAVARVRLSVRLSCPSVTFVHSIQMVEDIVKFFCRPGSPDSRCRCPIPTGPLQRGRKMQWGGKIFAIFDWNRRPSRKWYEIGPWLLWNVNRKSYALYRMVTFSVTLTDPNPVFKVTAFLKSNISKKLL